MDKIVIFLVSILILFFLAFPIRNWLEIQQAKKKKKNLEGWLLLKPKSISDEQSIYQEIEQAKCSFCGSTRYKPIPKSAVDDDFKFGIMSNKSHSITSYSSFYCAGCGTEIYRIKKNTKVN